MGIDWWEHDPTLSSRHTEIAEENRRLRDRIAALEGGAEEEDEEDEDAVERREPRAVDRPERSGRPERDRRERRPRTRPREEDDFG
jgi:hypothetical protein